MIGTLTGQGGGGGAAADQPQLVAMFSLPLPWSPLSAQIVLVSRLFG